MSSVSRYNDLFIRFGWLLIAGCAMLGGSLFVSFRSLPTVCQAEAGGAKLTPVSGAALSGASLDWSVVQGREPMEPGLEKTLFRKRFRLAGTFFLDDMRGKQQRRAILDDAEKGFQHVVKEGDDIGSAIRVVQISKASVILRSGNAEEELWLSFSGPGGGVPGVGTAGTGVTAVAEAASDRFGGKRVGEHAWVYGRQALMDYYRELMDRPERLVKVFDSLKPVYDANRRIAGYQVDIQGEPEFFESTGLRQGDVVRSANSMAMTSRRRAEYLIGEFVQDRLNAFILEIDRNGANTKQTYQIRQ